MENQKIMFVGSIYSDNFANILKRNGLPSSSAGQTFERGLLSGLSEYCDIKCLSEFFAPSFPKLNKIYIQEEQFSTAGIHCECISYINLPIIKKISQFFSYLIKIKRSLGAFDSIIIYELTSRQLLSAVIAGRAHKKIVVVPDLPEFMSDNANIIYRVAKRIDRILINWALKYIDGYVLFSPYMKGRLPIGEKPWTVIEGLFSPNDIIVSQHDTKKKVLLYTGKIEKWFGLDDLLSAFTRINGSEYELWLCGPGDIEMVKNYSNKDHRIIYKGCLSHKEVLILQKQTTILVNPRHSFDEFTLYSFPSKTMEYMASGTPTLMCKLKSLPEDYYPYLFFFDDETVDGMSKKIKECLDMDPVVLTQFGHEASLFILSNKTASKQAKKIVDNLL